MRLAPSLRLMAVLSTLSTLFACDSGTANEGVFQITVATEQPGCTGPTTPLTFAPTFVFVSNENFLGTEFITVVDCADVADCQAMAGEDTIFLGQYTFDEGNDDDGWTGSSGYATGTGDCTGQITTNTLSFPGGALRIDGQVKDVSWTADTCEYDEAERLAASAPCASAEVLEATRVADL